jgi:hypothetical protein
MNSFICWLLHAIGWASMIVATFWILMCFIEINLFGQTVIGMEPILFVRLGELAVFVYASCYAVYACIHFFRTQ